MDTKDGKVFFAFNIRTQIATQLFTAKVQRPNLMISVSPNGRNVAYPHEATKLFADIPRLKHFQTRGVKFTWANDSSMLFSVITPHVTERTNPSTYFETLEIVDASTGQVFSGDLPRGYHLLHGTFVGRRELLLWASPYDDPFGNEDGVVLSCHFPNLSCRTVVSGIRHASFNEKGQVAVTKWHFKAPPSKIHEDATILPDRYVVQVIERSSRVLPVAEFSGMASSDVVVTISPSGDRVVAKWLLLDSHCQRAGGMGPCERGALFDLQQSNRKRK